MSEKSLQPAAGRQSATGQLAGEIRHALLKEGASLVGFADIRCLPPGARQSMDYAISVGVALNPAVVGRVIKNGPTWEYSYEKVRANQFLNYLGEFAAELLKDRGYDAVPMLSDRHKSVDQKTASTPLPHKTIATRAGLGWIGKSALLVTEEYGPALRLNSILTNATLKPGTPIDASRCGECHECANACPAKAINGNLWDLAKSREDAIQGRNYLVDPMKCAPHFFNQSKKMGIEAPEARVCGICMAACPGTKRYLSRHGFPGDWSCEANQYEKSRVPKTERSCV